VIRRLCDKCPRDPSFLFARFCQHKNYFNFRNLIHIFFNLASLCLSDDAAKESEPVKASLLQDEQTNLFGNLSLLALLLLIALKSIQFRNNRSSSQLSVLSSSNIDLVSSSSSSSTSIDSSLCSSGALWHWCCGSWCVQPDYSLTSSHSHPHPPSCAHWSPTPLVHRSTCPLHPRR
jgi:hypothetical protein